MLDTLDVFAPLTCQHQTQGLPIPFWMLSPEQVAAHALSKLWQEKEYAGTPLLFKMKVDEHLYHPELLEKVVQATDKAKHRKHAKPAPGQLHSWEALPAPAQAGDIGAIPLRKGLYDGNMLIRASIYDHNTVPGPRTDGWFAYGFEGWNALSVLLGGEGDDDEAIALVAIPVGKQDEWLAFQTTLRSILHKVLRRQRRSRVEVLGSPEEGRFDMQAEIKKTTFEQVILPQELVEQVLSQRTIFQPEILKRYEALRVPRLRKVLLIGPPGTGKTTLVKAFAAEHLRSGGYVVYVFAESDENRTWHRLRHALQSAVNSGLPTVVVVEDLENFVTEKNLQQILNTLDGVATPDNRAGTLLLATTNAPERIDRRITQRPGRIDVMIEIGAVRDEAIAIRLLERFLHTAYNPQEHNSVARKLIGQVGSHVREVCLLAAIHAVEQNRDYISRDDLLWSNDILLNGRKAAANIDTCEPPKAKGNGGVGFAARN